MTNERTVPQSVVLPERAKPDHASRISKALVFFACASVMLILVNWTCLYGVLRFLEQHGRFGTGYELMNAADRAAWWTSMPLSLLFDENTGFEWRAVVGFSNALLVSGFGVSLWLAAKYDRDQDPVVDTEEKPWR